MSNKTFYICLGILASIMTGILILGGCTIKKSEQEVKELDARLTPIPTLLESPTTAFSEPTEEITTEETTTAPQPSEGGEDASSTDNISTDEHSVPGGTDNTDTVFGVDELAEIVLNQGINGDERKAYLGDRYEEVQAYIDANHQPPTYEYEEEVYTYQPDTGYYYSDGALTPDAGIFYFNGILETYYDLDMSWNIEVMRSMGFDEVNYPYWIRSDGCKMLGDYIMVAADFGWEPRGTFTQTSLGAAIVVDTGAGGWYWHDICVSGW